MRPSDTHPLSPHDHWTAVYSSKPADSVSWYQAIPALSLDMIGRAATPPARVLDVGGGASLLVDRLLDRGYEPGVLDISDAALRVAQLRLGPAAARVTWIVNDVTAHTAARPWDVWHDRAVFHFLIEEAQRSAYRESLLASTRIGAGIVVATFGPDGPTRCSGLPTMRYDADSLAATLGSRLALEEAVLEDHATPSGGSQQFIYCRFTRVA